MDKNAIKKYAVWARRELISRVSQRAALYEITEKGFGDENADSVLGRVLSASEKQQRKALIAQINAKGYKQVMEEAAYTWFNRFIALRFMEVNAYLPSHVRVFTDEQNSFKPQILTEAIDLELDGLNRNKVYELKNANADEALFKYLIIVQCNALSSILPGMFQKIDDYTELLFPDNLLRTGSVIEQMITMIPEADWQDQVQIIGWLYQYYNTELKDETFDLLNKKHIKITKDRIPAATQLFTPDWIVRYMVENSLGRLWVEGHPNDTLKAGWKYYLEEAEQEPEVQAQLAEIRKEYAALKPEDIKCIDPCSGSGHILAYMFDVLVQIYEAYGYTAREAASSIVENNIYGLDIDDRAAQLAYFSVMMKARQYDTRFFKRGKQPHVFAIRESNRLDSHAVEYFCDGRPELKRAMDILMAELHDAKEYGSILNVTMVDFPALYARFDEVFDDASMYRSYVLNNLLPFVQAAEALAQKYHAVVTNPPYMGAGNMSAKLSDYVKTCYPDSKSDLFAVFIEKCGAMTVKYGYRAMITQHSWMFLSSFEKLRLKIQVTDIVNMAHLGARAFEEIGGEVVQTVSFVTRNRYSRAYKGTYCRLIEANTQQGKEEVFLGGKNRYITLQDDFSKIPGSPVAYYFSNHVFDIFNDTKKMPEFAITRLGMTTANNELFVRLWYEVQRSKCIMRAESKFDVLEQNATWVPYNKGGTYRKWYGNLDFVVNWEKDGYAIRHFGEETGHIRSTVPNTEYYFVECGTWSKISAGNIAIRYRPRGSIFDVAGACLFSSKQSTLLSIIAFLNSSVAGHLLSVLSPTMNFEGGHISSLPVRLPDNDALLSLVNNNIDISHADWDAFETSWDFKVHPLVQNKLALWDITNVEANLSVFGIRPNWACPLEVCYQLWQAECEARFRALKANEEELNRIFIDIYGLQDELTPEVEDKDVTVRRADLGRDIRSFISYAVGCMLGRYSLDVPGLAYAGGDWDESKYMSFLPDRDGILPITDDEYFEDDIVERFAAFVKVVYGADKLEENLKFIADALGGKGSPRDVIRSYFQNDFFADHCKVYQKRPIYWLFDSGKKNGFKALIYLHRYRPDTIARIRTDYVHEQQSRYRTAIADLEGRIANAATSERVKLSKQLTKLTDQAEELRLYEEKIHHLADRMIKIDLDDGVKVNYAKFEDVLAKIK